MSKKPTRVFWIVRYRLWGADGESYMWFDHKEDAEPVFIGVLRV